MSLYAGVIMSEWLSVCSSVDSQSVSQSHTRREMSSQVKEVEKECIYRVRVRVTGLGE